MSTVLFEVFMKYSCKLLSFVSGYTTSHKGDNENRVVSSNCTSGGQQTGHKVSIRIQRAKWNGNSVFFNYSTLYTNDNVLLENVSPLLFLYGIIQMRGTSLL